jgi:hypothetical protein
VNSEKKAEERNYYERILSSVVSFLVSSGLSREEIRAALERELEAKATVVERAKRSPLGGNADTVFALVLHKWHREPRLLDDEAKPKPVKLLGKYPSVEALIREESPEAPARKLVAAMIEAGLVKKAKTGNYLPSSRIATVSSLHPMLVEHVTNSLVRYLGTVQQNTSPSRTAPTLIERYTHVPDLSVEMVDEFRDFAQSHGTGFLASVDDWLERRRAKIKSANNKGEGVSAGIHVFAYVENQTKKKIPTRRAKRA